MGTTVTRQHNRVPTHYYLPSRIIPLHFSSHVTDRYINGPIRRARNTKMDKVTLFNVILDFE